MFGVVGLSGSVAAGVDDYGVRIMTLCPGEIDKQMISDALNLGYNLCCKRNEMQKPEGAAEKILDMITKARLNRNAQCVEFYRGSNH
jgi:short-subunit dehydrogenase